MNIASLFNLAGPDLFVILIIVLLLFGAKKLPELAKGLGQGIKEFKKATTNASPPTVPRRFAPTTVAPNEDSL